VNLGTSGRVQQPMPKNAYGCRDKCLMAVSHTAAKYATTKPLRLSKPENVNNLTKVVAQQCTTCGLRIHDC